MATSLSRAEKGSISICFVQSILEPVAERGLDMETLLLEAGISPFLVQTPQARVSAQSFSALWLAVARALEDELFGQDSRGMKVGSFALLAKYLVHSATLKDALEQMMFTFNLLLDDFRCNVEVGPRRFCLNISHTAGRRTSPVLGCEALLMMQHGLACWLIGRRIPILESAFCYPEPAYSREYVQMYSSRLSFDTPTTSLAFDSAYLDLPVVQTPKTAIEFVRQAPGNIILKYKNSTGLAAQIRRRLRAASRTEWPDFADFAAMLDMAPSTLRRRLQDEGASFQGIKDQLRRDMAIDYLCHTDRSVTDIACELGFSEASAFHRAFKKWTGANPGEYRARMLQS